MRSLFSRLFRTRKLPSTGRTAQRQRDRKLLMESLEDRRVFNAAPTINWAAGTGIYRETAPAFILASGGTIADTDSANFDTGALTVSITSGGATGDKLSVVNTGNAAGQIGVSGTTVSYGGTAIGTISGGLNGNALLVSLNASSSPAAAQQLLRNVAFSNTATLPTIGNRTIVATIDDGDGASATTTNVKTMYVNQLPVAAADAYSTNEDTTLTVSLPGLLTNDTDADGDAFTVSKVNGSTANVGAAIALTGGSLTVNANGSFTFVPTANWNGTQTFTYNVKDVLERPTTATVTLTVSSVDDAVVFSATSDPNQTTNTVTFTEDGPAVVLLPAATLTDIDASSLTTLTVAHTGPQGGSDRLDIANQGTSAGQIGWSLTSGSTASGTYSGSLTYGGTSIGSFSAAGYSSALTVTLSGATLPAVQALIRAVTFNNTNTYNPATNTRTLLFTLAGANQTVSCSVNIVAVNDAPQISLGGGVGYTERSAAVQIASAATVTDDVTTLVGRTITVSFSGTADSQATLAVKNVGTGAQQIGVSGSNITYSGATMATFSGGTAGSPLVVSVGSNASLAAIQAMVRQITYVSDNHNPAASYTLSLAFNDGDGLTTTANKTINVTPIDEPLDPHDDVIELVAPASGSTYTVAAPGVLANDDPDTSYTLGLAIPAAQGTVTLMAGGGFTYTPNSGATGSDSFAYTIGSDPTVHFVTVNMPPAAGSTSGNGWIRLTTHNVKEGTDYTEYVTVELLGTLASNESLQVDLSTFDFSGHGSAQNPADHGSLPTNVVFTYGGVASLTSMLSITNDSIVEPDIERFRVDATPSLMVNGTASQRFGTLSNVVWIQDDDADGTAPTASPTVTVTRLEDADEVESRHGNFRVSRTGDTSEDLIVKLAFSGSATQGTDYDFVGLYSYFNNTVKIPAGSPSVDVDIQPYADRADEPVEEVRVAVIPYSWPYNTPYTPGAGTATVAISDGWGRVTISTEQDQSIVEDSQGSRAFKVTFWGGEDNGVSQVHVSLGLSGTATPGAPISPRDAHGTAEDYFIDDGWWFSTPNVADIVLTLSDSSPSYRTLYLYPTTDGHVESDEVATIEVLGGYYNTSGGSNGVFADSLANSVAFTITNDDSAATLTITAIDATASEGDNLFDPLNSSSAYSGDQGIIEITRTGSLTHSLWVPFSFGGSAERNVDYRVANGYPDTYSTGALIPAGESTITLTIAAKKDRRIESDETATVTIGSSADIECTSPTATVTIADNDGPASGWISVSQPPGFPTEYTGWMWKEESTYTQYGGYWTRNKWVRQYEVASSINDATSSPNQPVDNQTYTYAFGTRHTVQIGGELGPINVAYEYAFEDLTHNSDFTNASVIGQADAPGTGWILGYQWQLLNDYVYEERMIAPPPVNASPLPPGFTAAELDGVSGEAYVDQVMLSGWGYTGANVAFYKRQIP
jgi:hypothetical protein